MAINIINEAVKIRVNNIGLAAIALRALLKLKWKAIVP